MKNKDDCFEILNKLKTNIYYLSLKKCSKRAKYSVAIKELCKFHPVTLDEKDIRLEPNRKKNHQICFVNLNLENGKKYISTDLFIKNRFKNFSGNILVKTRSFSEILTLKEGNIEKSVIENDFEKLTEVYEYSKVITEEDLIKNAKSCDFLENVDFSQRIRKVILIFISLICILMTVLFCVKERINVISEKQQISKEIERKKKEEAKILKDKENRLENLKKEYESIMAEKLPAMYLLVSIIYKSIGSDSKVNTLNIDKKTFTLDVNTKNAVKILSRFEDDRRVSKIQMNRTSNKAGIENVTYTGNFSIFSDVNENKGNIDEEINFYEKVFFDFEEQKKRIADMKPSFYAGKIREALKKKNCSEGYMQFRKVAEENIFECYFSGSAKNVLSFLNEIQNKENDFSKDCVISGLKIRNSQDSDFLKVTVLFPTGIKGSENELYLEKEIANLKPSEIENMFSNKKISLSEKKELSKPFTENMTQKVIATKVEEKKYIPVKKETKMISERLKYIGRANGKDGELVIAKNVTTNSIFSLSVKKDDGEVREGFCKRNIDGTYIAIIGGKTCEILQ